MKKVVKRLFAVMLVAVMAMGLASVAYASEASPAESTKYTITVNTTVENPGTFNAYQVFKGDLATDESGNKILSNIQWGSSITDGDSALAAIKAIGDGKFAECADAAAVAKVLGENPDLAKAFAQAIEPYLGTVAGTTNELAPNTTKADIEVTGAGYYMVKSEAPAAGTENYAETLYILTVVDNVSVTEKADIPSVSKKVKDINDTSDSDIQDNEWNDTADFDIGDEVPFKLTGTLPSNYDDYKTYKYVFHDTLSEGFTYNGDAKVYVKKPDGSRVDITDKFKITSEDTSITISCDDLKAAGVAAGDVIEVEYSATLNTDAIIGSAGNPNEVYLEYSNNPNQGGEGDTGTTPEDKVVVFTFELDVNKVNEKKEPLEGAGFTLYKKVPADTEEGFEWKQIGDEVKGDEMTTFTFKGLDDGDYKLVETTVPPTYNKIDDVEFTISATHTDETLTLDSVTFTSKSDDVTITSGTGKDGEGAIGVGSTDVMNQKGSQLPSTGGIGTTIFYIVGGILVVVAGVLLITKKRMSHQD